MNGDEKLRAAALNPSRTRWLLSSGPAQRTDVVTQTLEDWLLAQIRRHQGPTEYAQGYTEGLRAALRALRANQARERLAYGEPGNVPLEDFPPITDFLPDVQFERPEEQG